LRNVICHSFSVYSFDQKLNRSQWSFLLQSGKVLFHGENEIFCGIEECFFEIMELFRSKKEILPGINDLLQRIVKLFPGVIVLFRSEKELLRSINEYFRWINHLLKVTPD